jgi:hypothetical protein
VGCSVSCWCCWLGVDGSGLASCVLRGEGTFLIRPSQRLVRRRGRGRGDDGHGDELRLRVDSFEGLFGFWIEPGASVALRSGELVGESIARSTSFLRVFDRDGRCELLTFILLG